MPRSFRKLDRGESLPEAHTFRKVTRTYTNALGAFTEKTDSEETCYCDQERDHTMTKTIPYQK